MNKQELYSWLSKELSLVLETPIENSQRLNATRVFIANFIQHKENCPDHFNIEMSETLWKWQHQKQIKDGFALETEDDVDWFESIVGTIDGILV